MIIHGDECRVRRFREPRLTVQYGQGGMNCSTTGPATSIHHRSGYTYLDTDSEPENDACTVEDQRQKALMQKGEEEEGMFEYAAVVVLPPPDQRALVQKGEEDSEEKEGMFGYAAAVVLTLTPPSGVHQF